MRHHENTQKERGSANSHLVRVWDLPTRLFHWLIVIFVVVSFTTGMAGGNWMAYHLKSGFIILTLLLFRLIWGFWGGRYSRFIAFVQGPVAVMRYAITLFRKDTPKILGHNPMGGWSAMAMLAALAVQVGTGLFANDDIATQGPLYGWVGKATSDWLTGIHVFNKGVILFLIALHISAVLFYLFIKHDNLIVPMVTGLRPWREPA
ncbi:MAG: cytochrome b/b6 domain-containing protein, partial [Desulfobacterales bacterium]|nr:cytochrome b/b6 domain-containing protein [Desulfobacterales bacterium]